MILIYSDIEIAMAQTPKDIQILAREIGLQGNELDMFGKKKAKVSLTVLKRLQHQPNGKYIVVTGYFIYIPQTNLQNVNQMSSLKVVTMKFIFI